MYHVSEGDRELKNAPFRETRGSLMFLANVSRPDITFAVNNVSQFLNKHDEIQCQVFKRIFQYLSGSLDLGILYRSCQNDFTSAGYFDSDYESDINTRRSVSGFAFHYVGGDVSLEKAKDRNA